MNLSSERICPSVPLPFVSGEFTGVGIYLRKSKEVTKEETLFFFFFSIKLSNVQVLLNIKHKRTGEEVDWLFTVVCRENSVCRSQCKECKGLLNILTQVLIYNWVGKGTSLWPHVRCIEILQFLSLMQCLH